MVITIKKKNKEKEKKETHFWHLQHQELLCVTLMPCFKPYMEMISGAFIIIFLTFDHSPVDFFFHSNLSYLLKTNTLASCFCKLPVAPKHSKRQFTVLSMAYLAWVWSVSACCNSTSSAFIFLSLCSRLNSGLLPMKTTMMFLKLSFSLDCLHNSILCIF